MDRCLWKNPCSSSSVESLCLETATRCLNRPSSGSKCSPASLKTALSKQKVSMPRRRSIHLPLRRNLAAQTNRRPPPKKQKLDVDRQPTNHCSSILKITQQPTPLLGLVRRSLCPSRILNSPLLNKPPSIRRDTRGARTATSLWEQPYLRMKAKSSPDAMSRTPLTD